MKIPTPKKAAVKNLFLCEPGTFNVAFLFILLSVFALSFSELSPSPQNPAPGVVAELLFNEGTGTTAADGSGNSHTGTLVNGPVWETGKYGQGLNFDGTNDYVDIADHANFTLDPAQSYSWSGWVKNNNFNEWSTVWSQTVNSANFFCFYANTTSDPDGGPVTNGISVYWWGNNGADKLCVHSNNNVLSAGQWSYITVTYDASQPPNDRFTIYVNGVDVTDRTDISSAGAITAIDPANIRVGSNETIGEYLNGSVDEVRYYRRLLSLAEVESDMNIGNTPDTEIPTVNITAPLAGNVGGTINVIANASDNIGVVGVQFLLDGVSLDAEELIAPYSVSWNTTTAANSNHTLTAIARDAAGNTTTSADVIVTVFNDTQSPTLSITGPSAGNVGGTINVTANASDNVGIVGVQFLLDGINLEAEDLIAPYSVSWNTTTAANNNHTLTAIARDGAGNTTTSADVIVTIFNDTELPTISITGPSAGNVGGTINVTANASDNVGVVGVQFLLDGVNLHAEDLIAPYSVSWNTTTAINGNHTLTAIARDAAGNTVTSADVIVTVFNDTQSPTISITGPSAGNVSGTINVTANASDNVGVVGVQFLLDGVNLGSEDLASPYSVSWNTLTSINGNHILTARARDAAGNSGNSASVSVTVFNSNLVLALGFNENTGTIANDNSGNGNTGTLTNGPLWSVSGKYGSAVLFDGLNDFININDANSLDLTNGMTMEAWVNPSNVTGYKTIICKDRTATSYSYTLAANNNTTTVANQRPNSRLRIGSANQTITGTSKLPLNTWTHIASTYDGVTFRLFVNGVQVTSLATTGNITVSTGPLRIGGTTALSAQYFTGLIDEVRVYNKALTQAEIQTNMNTPIAPDITNPTVSITAPVAGNVSGTINVTANAADNINVAGVQFLLDGVNLGAEDIVAPYSVSWNTLTAANGNHTLTARARDAAGNTATSADVIVSVFNDTQLPTVSITAPPAGNVSGTINLTADAFDNVVVIGVQFLLGGVNLGTEDLTAPYSLPWNTTTAINGSHILTARARDGAGNPGNSSTVTVTVFNNNLVAAFGFNENNGTIVYDISGNGNWGTLTNGPTWSTTGKYGRAILFDGNNDFVNINDANLLDLTNGMTLEAWVNPSNLTGYKTVICKENGTNNLAYVLSANNSTSGTANQRPNSRIRIGNTTKTVTGTTKLALNTWAHIASTYDGAIMRFYVNSVQVSTFPATGNITTTANPLRIGGSAALGAQYFAGLIDEVRIYSRALSQAEIQTDMNTQVGGGDTTPPSSFTLSSPGSSANTINLSWTASTDSAGVAGYDIYVNGTLNGTTTGLAYTVSQLTPSTAYSVYARARDAAGNFANSNTISPQTIADAIAPAAPTNLAGSPTGNTIDLSWNASTDNIGVIKYYIFFQNTLLDSSILTTYTITGLANYTTYNNIFIKAIDAARNSSAASNIISVSTISSIIVGTLTAVSTFESIGLYWAGTSGQGGGPNVVCNVQYRVAGSNSSWKIGYPLWYDVRQHNANDVSAAAQGYTQKWLYKGVTRPANEYRGSIVGLTAGTDYEIQVSLQGTSATNTITKATWEETNDWHVASTVAVPNGSNGFNITSGGTAGNYIKYQPANGISATINVNNGSRNCIWINAPYIIISKLTLIGASEDGIRLGPNAHDILIDSCDISGWGYVGMGSNNQAGVRIAGFKDSCYGVERVVIQNCKIHESRDGSTSWDPGGSHPGGPNGINFEESGGNHVIRYNEIYGNANHYFMDGIGGGDNFTKSGFTRSDMDIYGNRISMTYDDGIEAEGANVNCRIWNNFLDNTFTGISNATNSVGPMYIFRNVTHVSQRSHSDSAASTIDAEDRGPFNKCGGNGDTAITGGRTYLFHNTILEPTQAGFTYARGMSGGPVDNGGAVKNIVSRNNIWQTHKPNDGGSPSIGEWQSATNSGNTYDYDLYNGNIIIAATGGQGTHLIYGTPVYVGGTPTAPIAINSGPRGAGYYLQPGTPGYDAGVLLPNFNENYQGVAPDVGAYENGGAFIITGIRRPPSVSYNWNSNLATNLSPKKTDK